MSEGIPNRAEVAPHVSKRSTTESLRKEEEKRSALEPLIDTYAKLRERGVKDGKQGLELAIEIESIYRDAGMTDDAIDAAYHTAAVAIREGETPLLERVGKEIERLKKESVERYVSLARELNESPERFPFPGITDEAYKTLKVESKRYREYVTDIDVVLQKLKQFWMKVEFGTDPDSGNVFILHGDSDDLDRDSILPKHLKITDDMDPRLKELILSNRRRQNWK